MKRSIVFKIFVLLAIAGIFNSCKKDYPDDIPKWLKQKIHDYKIYNDNCNYYYGMHRIEEWEYKGEKAYSFNYSGGEIFYNNIGEEMCMMYIGHFPSCRSTTSNITYSIKEPYWKYVRIIWDPQCN